GNEPADGEGGSQDLRRSRRAAAGEPADRPTALHRDLPQARVRVGGPGIADDGEQREVLVAVAVEVALVEVDVVACREIARMNGLAFAVAGGLQHLAREVAVADLEAGAEHVADV